MLPPEEVQEIVLADGELAGFAFVGRDEVAALVTPLLARRVASCLDALAAGVVVARTGPRLADSPVTASAPRLTAVHSIRGTGSRRAATAESSFHLCTWSGAGAGAAGAARGSALTHQTGSPAEAAMNWCLKRARSGGGRWVRSVVCMTHSAASAGADAVRAGRSVVVSPAWTALNSRPALGRLAGTGPGGLDDIRA